MSANDKQISRKENLPFMENEMYQRLINLLHRQSSTTDNKEITDYIISYIEEMEVSYSIDKKGNIIVIKGHAKIYPCIVSHIDTVHNIIKKKRFGIFYQIKDGRKVLTAQNKKKQIGIGGDDKCGILACLEMLNYFDNIKVVFFSGEESGCIGSSNIDKTFFDNVGYIIQLDRYGRSDFICQNYGENTVSESFLNLCKPLLLKYNYKPTEGLITDSINLWNNNIGISAINVSCGYYLHHTDGEFIDTNELYNSILFTKDIISILGENRYESKPEIKKVLDWSYSYYNYKDDFWNESKKDNSFNIDNNNELYFDNLSYIEDTYFTDNINWLPYKDKLNCLSLFNDLTFYEVKDNMTFIDFTQLVCQYNSFKIDNLNGIKNYNYDEEERLLQSPPPY